MEEIQKLFGEDGNPDCSGCPILEIKKPVHSYMDYKELVQAPILFVSDSLKMVMGVPNALRRNERALIQAATHYIKEDIEVTASVKCPSIREADMPPEAQKICRKHLSDSIDVVKPTLVLPMGNLAMKMITKKSGIKGKRGKAFEYESDGGHKCTVVPIYHPLVVVIEPKFGPLFFQDIRVAYDKYIRKIIKPLVYDSTLVMEIDGLKQFDFLKTTETPVSIDIESEGLNFLTDKMHSIAFSWREDGEIKCMAIPVEHKDHVWSPADLAVIMTFIRLICKNPDNRKVLQNAKFDQKFLLRYGIEVVRVWDTMVMFHMGVSEDEPKGLADLVKKYFHEYLEHL